MLELGLLVALVVIAAVGSKLRDDSYAELFESLKTRKKVKGFVGPDYTWSDDERIISGQMHLGSWHSNTIKRLKKLELMVPHDEFLGSEKLLVRRVKIAQQSMLPLLLYAIFLLIKYSVFHD